MSAANRKSIWSSRTASGVGLEREISGASDNDAKACINEKGDSPGVLLLYQDFSTGVRARQALDQVVRQFDLGADFKVVLWRFDLLREPEVRERAATEAATADIVFLSAHSLAEIPWTAEI